MKDIYTSMRELKHLEENAPNWDVIFELHDIPIEHNAIINLSS
jgi:hypothetical protein